MPKNLIKSEGMSDFFETHRIYPEDIREIDSKKKEYDKIESTAYLFKRKRIRKYSALELGIVVYNKEEDVILAKKRAQALLAYMFRNQKNALKRINLPYAQFLRIITGNSKTNMLELLGFQISEECLERYSKLVYKFRPSYNDWYEDVCLPYPIDENASFGLGVLWARGAVQRHQKPSIAELTTTIYPDRYYLRRTKSRDANSLKRITSVLKKMFNVDFRITEWKSTVEYPKGEIAEYSGIRIIRQSMAIGSFLVNTLGINIGPLYSDKRKNLPMLYFNEQDFLNGYRFFRRNSRNTVYAPNQALAEKIIELSRKTGVSLRILGNTSKNCYHIGQ